MDYYFIAYYAGDGFTWNATEYICVKSVDKQTIQSAFDTKVIESLENKELHFSWLNHSYYTDEYKLNSNLSIYTIDELFKMDGHIIL